MREIDRHLATCPMCSDAVEGLMLLSKPTIVLDNLNKKIDEKVGNFAVGKTVETPPEMRVLPSILTVVKRPFWQQRWAAAAAILLFVTGSFWIFNNAQKFDKQAVASKEATILPNSDTATNFNAPPQYATSETTKNATENVVKTVAPIELREHGKTTKTTTPSGFAGEEMADDNTNLKDDLGKKQADRVGEKPLSDESKSNADIAIMDNASVQPNAPAPAPTYSAAPAYDRTEGYAGAANMNSVPRTETATSAKPKKAPVTKFEEKGDNAKQSKSKESAQEVAVTSAAKAQKQGTSTPSVSGTSDQLLSRADLYFKQKYYETAAADYAQFINLEPSGDRYERAFFQLATCYVNMNRKADAKVMFQKLVGMNGTYERAAKKALKDL